MEGSRNIDGVRQREGGERQGDEKKEKSTARCQAEVRRGKEEGGKSTLVRHWQAGCYGIRFGAEVRVLRKPGYTRAANTVGRRSKPHFSEFIRQRSHFLRRTGHTFFAV